MINRLSICACLFWSCYACELINPAEEIPSYITADQATITTTALQGASTAKITNVSITAKGDDLGVFPLPATIPILQEGPTEVIILHHVQVNGRSEFIKAYPFYKAVIKTLDLVPAQPSVIDIRTTYIDQVRFAFIEDFESGINFFIEDFDQDKATTITRSDMAASGSKSGWILLNQEHPTMEIASLEYSDVLNPERDVFLELDYKNQVDFSVLAELHFETGIRQLRELSSFRVREEWNKVYITLTDEARVENLQGIKIIIRASIKDDPDISSANVYLDNIKLVYQ